MSNFIDILSLLKRFGQCSGSLSSPKLSAALLATRTILPSFYTLATCTAAWHLGQMGMTDAYEANLSLHDAAAARP